MQALSGCLRNSCGRLWRRAESAFTNAPWMPRALVRARFWGRRGFFCERFSGVTGACAGACLVCCGLLCVRFLMSRALCGRLACALRALMWALPVCGGHLFGRLFVWWPRKCPRKRLLGVASACAGPFLKAWRALNASRALARAPLRTLSGSPTLVWVFSKRRGNVRSRLLGDSLWFV